MKKVVRLTFYFSMGVQINNDLGVIGDFSFKIAKNCCTFYWIEGGEGGSGKP